jgi:hypothetical protein
MALNQKFQEAFTCHTIKIGSLQTDRPYPITHAERVNTRFEFAVLLSIRDSTFTIKVFLPRRYGEVVTEVDIASINSLTAKLNGSTGMWGCVYAYDFPSKKRARQLNRAVCYTFTFLFYIESV